MTSFEGADLRGAQFREVDLTGARVEGANLTNVKMSDVWLVNVDIDGLLNGVKINGVDWPGTRLDTSGTRLCRGCPRKYRAVPR